jgi:hypothetical protein
LIAGIVFAVAFAHAQEPGPDDIRALVCIIDRKDGLACKPADAEALARIEKLNAGRRKRAEEEKQRQQERAQEPLLP